MDKLRYAIVEAAKPKSKPYRLTDGRGLFLLVTPEGGKWWRLTYRRPGSAIRNTLSFGTYPATSLAEARHQRDEAKKLLAKGIDPGVKRKAEKAGNLANSFETVARRWFATAHEGRAESTANKNLTFFEKDVFPWIGKTDIAALAAPDLLAIIKRIESRGAIDIARRVHNLCGRVFRYGVAHGLCLRDPSRDISLNDVLVSATSRHHSAITDPVKVGALLRAIEAHTGAFVVQCALRLAPLVFVRPGELRHAEWSEIDFDAAQWRIPAHKMKMREQHIVPLSKQALGVLREIQPFSGGGKYVFPGERTKTRPISENAMNAALRSLGFTKDEMTAHGFRSMASTLLHERGFDHQHIERQLAHAERNKVSASYNFAQHLKERRILMQEWADYLDQLKGSNVIRLRDSV